MRDINLDNTASNLQSVAHKNYLLPQAKCNLYKGSFSYSGLVVWNSLPTSIKLASSLDTFVKKCTEWLKCKAVLHLLETKWNLQLHV